MGRGHVVKISKSMLAKNWGKARILTSGLSLHPVLHFMVEHQQAIVQYVGKFVYGDLGARGCPYLWAQMAPTWLLQLG